MHNHIEIYIKINGNYQLVKALQNVNYSLTNQLIDDKTFKENSWQKFLNRVKQQKFEIYFEGIKANNQLDEIFKNAFLLVKELELMISFCPNKLIYSKFIIKSYQVIAEARQEEKFKIILVSNGELIIEELT